MCTLSAVWAYKDWLHCTLKLVARSMYLKNYNLCDQICAYILVHREANRGRQRGQLSRAQGQWGPRIGCSHCMYWQRGSLQTTLSRAQPRLLMPLLVELSIFDLALNCLSVLSVTWSCDFTTCSHWRYLSNTFEMATLLSEIISRTNNFWRNQDIERNSLMQQIKNSRLCTTLIDYHYCCCCCYYYYFS